jgi:TRAP-type C4-dicarboxylate transport system permease small subunit
MEKSIGWIRKPIEAAIALCMAVMLVLVFGNVVLRYAFNSGLTVSDELSRLLFVWMVFLGALAALFERRHLGVDTLVAHLSRRGRLVCFLLSNALMLYATWLVFLGGWQQALITLDATTPVLGVSQAWFYAPVLLFSLASALWFVVQLLRAALDRIGDDELVEIRESEEDIDAAMQKSISAGDDDATGGRK